MSRGVKRERTKEREMKRAVDKLTGKAANHATAYCSTHTTLQFNQPVCVVYPLCVHNSLKRVHRRTRLPFSLDFQSIIGYLSRSIPSTGKCFLNQQNNNQFSIFYSLQYRLPVPLHSELKIGIIMIVNFLFSVVVVAPWRLLLHFISNFL